MAQVEVATRYSRTADRPGPANRSPFRSALPTKRIQAALAMIKKREREIAALNALLAETTPGSADERKLTTRLLASSNNLASWNTYRADNCPKEVRAVIIL